MYNVIGKRMCNVKRPAFQRIMVCLNFLNFPSHIYMYTAKTKGPVFQRSYTLVINYLLNFLSHTCSIRTYVLYVPPVVLSLVYTHVFS